MSLLVANAPPVSAQAEKMALLLSRWLDYPPLFVSEAMGASPDPWQCDVMDALYEYEADNLAIDNVAVRACHGVGKTALESWVILHFTMLHQFCRVPTTAPTFNKQVRDVLWGEVHHWYREMEAHAGNFLTKSFQLDTVRLAHIEHPAEWFAVGIASSKPINTEGYHAAHLLAVFDEAKGISKATFDAIQGMRTTQRAKLLVCSTPGGPLGEFFRIFTKYRTTWKKLFIIHPEALRATLKRPEAVGVDPLTGVATPGAFAKQGTYYSSRVRPEWVESRRLEWGQDSPVFIARCIGDFPDLEADVLIQYSWLTLAESKETGAPGDERWVSCDVARYGADRTVGLVGEGGTVLAGETIARTPETSSAQEAHVFGAIGDDPKRPLYRSTVATADFLQRLRQEWSAAGVIVDDTGLGGGVSDELRRRGERVIPINFGGAPTDKPKTPDQKKYRAARNLPETYFTTIKAQMGWALRNAFESGFIALGQLPTHILEPLIAQASLMKAEMDAAGRIRIVDPDKLEGDDDWAAVLGAEERRRSPDHFHALMLLWWACGTAMRMLRPQAQAVLPSSIATLGRGPGGLRGKDLPVVAQQKRGVGGPAAYLGGLYRR